MTDSALEILDVDLDKFENGSAAQRKAAIEGVTQSLKTGFVYSSHDVSEDLLDSAYGMLQQFFALSQEIKTQAVVPGSNGSAGYTGLLVETAANNDAADWKEMLNWGTALPDNHPLKIRFPQSYFGPVLPENEIPGITETLTKFSDALLDLQQRFLRIIAVGIGCVEDFFDEMTTNGTTLTRAIHYPAMQTAPGERHVWAAEHGDINLITALPRATARGLQVLVNDQWVDAEPPKGSAIINTGIMLERLTNGVIPQGIHRVVADPEQPGERYSVVQFCHPTPWTVLAPVKSCVTDHNPQRFAPIAAGDLLSQVLYDINLL